MLPWELDDLDLATVKEPLILLRIFRIFQKYTQDMETISDETTLTGEEMDVIAAIEKMRDIAWSVDEENATTS